jgi:hypothetical protein
MDRTLSVLGAVLMLTVVGCTTAPVCQIYFVPVGTFPDTMTQDLIHHYDAQSSHSASARVACDRRHDGPSPKAVDWGGSHPEDEGAVA